MEQNSIQATYDEANEHYRAGHRAEAGALFEAVVRQQPDHADALQMLGILAHQSGRNEEAAGFLRRAISARPGVGSYHSNLGLALMGCGRVDEAIVACRQAVALRPEQADAHNNLGYALMTSRAMDEAIDAFRWAIALRPDYPEALNNLGIALGEKKRLGESIATFRQAIALRPSYPQALSNLGNAMMFNGQLEAAIGAYRQSIAIQPDYAEAYNNLGGALQQAGQFAAAMGAFRKAIEFRPRYAEAHVGLALLHLLSGDYAQGFNAFEARVAMKDAVIMSGLTQPPWDGAALTGRRILLHSEQGLGDTIFYVRYASLVKSRGGMTIVRCQRSLKRLLINQPGINQVIDENDPLPEHDVQCPLASLPARFGTTLQTIPASIPYLRADPVLAERWQLRLSSLPRKVNIGLVWAGNPQFMQDRSRSISLDLLAPLSRIIGARFISLQKGEAAQQSRRPPSGLELLDWTEELADFADTAALVANLEAVVAVDTAVAHLAGAMGKPLGLMVPFAPDWRWGLARADSPWYSTFRLFRQQRLGSWDQPIQEMAATLNAIVVQRYRT